MIDPREAGYRMDSSEARSITGTHSTYGSDFIGLVRMGDRTGPMARNCCEHRGFQCPEAGGVVPEIGCPSVNGFIVGPTRGAAPFLWSGCIWGMVPGHPEARPMAGIP